MTDEIIRWATIAQIAVLLSCGLAWHRAYRPAVPAQLWRLGWVYGYVVAVVLAAVLVNLLANQPLTLGQQLLTAALVPATTYVAIATWRTTRLATRLAGLSSDPNQGLAGIAEHIRHLEPCENPDCQLLRERILAALPR